MVNLEALQELQEDLAMVLSDLELQMEVANGDVTIHVEPRLVPQVMESLRDHSSLKFKSFIDVCGVDWPAREKRFDVVYHLLSMVHNRRVRVKTMVGEDEPVPSITDVFPGALWFEREAYDMYGILFSGHPDLRRLLTDYGFEGYPLRKTFPLTGTTEVRYDEDLKRVVKEPVKLIQEFRDFDFESPWEGAQHLLPGDEKAATDVE